MPHTYRTGWRRPNAKAHVFIAIPTYSDIKAGCVSSLAAVQADLTANAINGDVAILAGDCHVDDARNAMARTFLETDATHLMFIDADLEFSATSVRQLLDYDEDIVAGVYPYKNDDENFPYILENPANVSFDERGLVGAVKGVPGGFTLIKRAVIEKLYKKNAAKGAWAGKGDAADRKPIVEIWHRTVELGKLRRSGDYEFCAKARKAGFKIWIAPNLRFAHVGDKRWEGVLQDFWRRKSGDYEREAVAAVARIRAGGEIDDFKALAKAFGNEPFSADHVLLSVLFDLAKSGDIKRALETGSGISSAVLAAAGCDVVSLEAEPIWGAKTDRLLASCGMDHRCTYAPIVTHDCGRWYDAQDGEFDLVFIDGPRRDEVGMRGRICDVMPKALQSAKVVIVDDTDDGDGMMTLARLNRDFGFVFDVHQGPRRQFAVGTRE